MGYKQERAMLLTESGQADLVATCFAVAAMEVGSTAVSGDLLSSACQFNGAIDSWAVLNSLDLLAERKYISCVNEGDNPRGQDRIYLRLK